MDEDKLKDFYTQYRQSGGGSGFEKFLKNVALFALDKGHTGHQVAKWAMTQEKTEKKEKSEKEKTEEKKKASIVAALNELKDEIQPHNEQAAEVLKGVSDYLSTGWIPGQQMGPGWGRNTVWMPGRLHLRCPRCGIKFEGQGGYPR